MISAETLAEVELRKWQYILGVRMRSSTEAKAVVARAGRYAEVHPKSDDRDDPSPLKVKEVWVEDARRYVVCVNEDQATKDRHDREAVVASLREALSHGDKSLVGNKGYRKYLRAGGKQFAVDEDKIQEEARYDGKWVLTTNTDLPTHAVALKYKQLWMVEDVFRSMNRCWIPGRFFTSATKRFAGTYSARFWRCYFARNCKIDWHERSGNWSGPTSSAIWTT